jgi:hypothetical protein
MREGALLVASLVGLLFAAGGAGPLAAQEADPVPLRRLVDDEPAERVARLLAEGVLVRAPGAADAAGRMVQAWVLFDRPVDRVYELLSATGRQREFRREIAAQTEVSRDAEGVVEEQRLRILFLDVVYRLRYALDPVARRIRWQLDPTFANDLRRVEGFWELFALDASRTLGRFGTAIDVGELPAFIEDSVTRQTLPGTLARCREWVNADGAPR